MLASSTSSTEHDGRNEAAAFRPSQHQAKPKVAAKAKPKAKSKVASKAKPKANPKTKAKADAKPEADHPSYYIRGGFREYRNMPKVGTSKPCTICQEAVEVTPDTKFCPHCRLLKSGPFLLCTGCSTVPPTHTIECRVCSRQWCARHAREQPSLCLTVEECEGYPQLLREYQAMLTGRVCRECRSRR